MQQVDFSIIRSEWMLNEASVPDLSAMARNYLAGSSLNVGFFSKLSLPDVPDSVALIPVNGVMTKADVCGGMGTRSLANAVMSAANDASKQSIILFFETVPGGQVDGTQEFADAVKMAKGKKPVLGAVSGLCASAGVWPLSQCTEAYAMANTDQIGCIGVMCKMKKGDDTANAEYEIIYSDLSPDKNAEFRDTQLLKDSYLNPTAKLFQQAVMEGRGNRLKTDAKGVLSGATFIAQAAKKNGLIDGVMPFSKILQRANYLTTKQKSSTMSANKVIEGQHVFQALLAAAKADAFIPVDEGFAMTEEHMTNADAYLVGLQAINTTLTDAATTHAAELLAANNALTTSEGVLSAAQEKIGELTAKLITMGGKAAIVPANPAAAADPVVSKEDFLTSTDKIVAARRAKYGIK